MGTKCSKEKYASFINKQRRDEQDNDKTEVNSYDTKLIVHFLLFNRLI